jgi:hypothetical protein
VFVDYWTLGIAGARTEFVDQIITSRMSSYGDSGSLLVDLKDRALGMLFAGSATHSYYNPMLEVTNAFQLGVCIPSGREAAGREVCGSGRPAAVPARAAGRQGLLDHLVVGHIVRTVFVRDAGGLAVDGCVVGLVALLRLLGCWHAGLLTRR